MIGFFHQRLVYQRRLHTLAQALASFLPSEAKALDVGCGDGELAARILERRPDVSIVGVDVLERKTARIPVSLFDGKVLPFEDRSFDAILCVDVLHHTEDPTVLLREFQRVARQGILLKDHFKEGWLAGWRLGMMDWVGNARHGVALPYNYWTRAQWESAWKDLDWKVKAINERLGLYPVPAKWVFESSLHFVAQLTPANAE